MKQKLTLLFFLAFVCKGLIAQVPQGIPYQSVIRNSNGTLVANQTVKMRFSLHDSIATGAVVYQETFSTTTNNLGLANVNIGMGTAVVGTFSGINWGKNSKFIQVEMDPNGGTNYTDMGTTQMMSVPYALYAGTAKTSIKAGTGITINGDTINAVNQNLISNAPNLTGKTNIGFASSGTWTCPAGVTQIMVQLWGGAGGGGANGGYYTGNNNQWYCGCGGKGGNGGYNMAIIDVIPGNIYTINIGNGGNGGKYDIYRYISQVMGTLAQTSSTSGQNSLFIYNGINLLIAQGGTAGSNASNPTTSYNTSQMPFAIDGVDGTISNYQPNLVSFNTASQLSSSLSYIPTGYIQSTLSPNASSIGGSPAGFYNNWYCPTYCGCYMTNNGQQLSGNGENGYCVISY
jgi:hypothetical protein